MIDDDDINQFVPSVLNPRALRKNGGDSTFLTQNSIVSRCSLSLKRNGATPRKWVRPVPVKDKENSQNQSNTLVSAPTPAKQASPTKTILKPVAGSLGFSAVEDLLSLGDDFMINHLPPEENCRNGDSEPFFFSDPLVDLDKKVSQNEIKADRSVVTVSSATELEEPLLDKSSDSTVIICENHEEKSIDLIGDINDDKPLVSLSFGFKNCENVNISTRKVDIRKVSFTHKDNHVLVDCDIVESSKISMESDIVENMTEEKGNTLKRPAVSVNLEIKKKRLLKGREDATEDTKLLILKTDAIEKVTHVIVQPPNYKLVKRKLTITAKSIAKTVSRPPRKNANITAGETLKQAPITAFFKSKPEAQRVLSHTSSTSGRLCNNVTRDEAQEMNKNLSVYGALKSDQVVRSHNKNSRNELNLSPRSTKLPLKNEASPKRQASGSEANRACLQMARNNSGSLYSPAKKTGDSTYASASTNSKSKTAGAAKSIPHHKIVAGTHFAVDAFSYGEIPNVKNYFLTHFHSDHYTGLKKTFSKTLFCSKITADLCMTRLGVNPKCIHVLKMDECVRVDSVEVLAVDANHCPGAVMLIFTLPNGRTILHTGDFRASPVMESYPIFWNKDIYSIYLDTTYCNPRYDFPTQDQSLDMALYLLRQKKVALEKIGKKFSSVLIVCGTYTIGKEKFFLGMARRVGCSVWACPEKDRVLQAVEGRSFSHAPTSSCQLHVVPMRDLTYDKLRSYLESLQGAFSEVVAFKPSGWENGKNSTVERDHVTIYGIPYSEHSSFSEMIRFVKFIKPKKVLPTVDISGGIKAVQKYFPCPLVYKEDVPLQSRMTDFSFSIHPRQPVPAVT